MISDQYLVVSDLILHKYVPLKVIVFALWLFRNRLPTKDNLFCKGIIPPSSQSCVWWLRWFRDRESLILGVSLHWFVMASCLKADWFFLCWSFCYFGSNYIVGNLPGFFNARYSIMLLFWFASTWIIWKEHNNMIFKKKKFNSTACGEC